DDVKSRLIESIIIRIPLPAFYVDGTNEENWLVVDGLQRLSALRQFVSDKSDKRLKLIGLELLTELEGKTYDELDRKYQRRIEETQVTVYLIEKGTPLEVKYNIFQRINTGGEPLVRQEIRHALNPGPALKLLAELANSSEFKKVVSLGHDSKKRMQDREFVLGAIAVMRTSYQIYDRMGRDAFLDDAMKQINKLPENEIKEIENQFKRTIVACYKTGVYQAFRKPPPKKRKFTANPVNKALFEAWFFNINKLNDQQIEKLKLKKEDLIKRFNESVSKNSIFFKSISNVSQKINYRFTTIEKIIEEVLND
ncbi:MAG: DUF262 domain-containing protein, partial [Okeania sp. SIO2H7]|nr:DUF262 domain-containing protein [Okeania sp. SIO2H7]